jgi:membrane-associated phospholipid phosphatase
VTRSHFPVIAPLLACVLVLAFFAQQVLMQGPMTRIDDAVTLFLAGNRRPWLTDAMLWIADAHETVKLLAFTVLVAMWRFWRGDRQSLRLLAVVPAGMLLNVALKHLFQRPRPALPEPLVHLVTFSYPSGHAAASTVFYGALVALVFARVRSPALRAMAAVAGSLMVLLVCFSRVYLGAHYLSDVIAGVAVGTACLVLFLAWQARPRQHAPPP